MAKVAKKKTSSKEPIIGNKTNSLVFIDFETGGFEPTKNAVTEVAMVVTRGDTLEVIDTLSTYVQPYGDYTYEESALKATGITFKDIDGGKPVEEVVDMMLALMKKADLYNSKGFKPILHAHNGEFDKGFWMQLMHYTKKQKEMAKLVYGHDDYFGNFQPYIQDTIVLVKYAFGHVPDFGNFKLVNALNGLGAELSDGHKAINDTIGLKEGIINFIKALRVGLGQGDVDIQKQGRFREHFQF